MPVTPYQFPGLTPFFQRTAMARGSDPQQLNRCNGLWHAGQIQSALGQLPHLMPIDRRALMSHCERVREGLAMALEGIDAAMLEVTSELDMPAPSFAQSPADTKPIRRREHAESHAK